MQTAAPLKANSIRIMDRYLLSRYLVPFGYCLAAFLLVILIYDFSINLEDFIDGKVRLDIILEYLVCSIPVRIVEVVPMATLLSVLYALGLLKRHNEIIAFQASGISPTRLMRPFLFFGALLSLTVLGINETLVPPCRQRVAKIETAYMKKSDVAKTGTEAKIFAFYNLQQNRSWVGILDVPKKKVRRAEIREFDSQDRVLKKITAESAERTDQGWKMTDGKLTDYEGSPLGGEKIQPFQDAMFNFPETIKDLSESQKDPELMNLWELKNHIRTHPKHSRVFHEEKVEYYHKWAYPFLNLLVMLMGVPLGLKSERGDFLVGTGTSLVLFLTYYGVHLVCLTLGKNETIAAWLAGWLPNILFGVVGLWLLRRTK